MSARRLSAQHGLGPADVDRIIEMAWEDRTPFEAIRAQFGLGEAEVIRLMQQELRPESWRRWRARVQGRPTKHRQRSPDTELRFKCSRQRDISRNRGR